MNDSRRAARESQPTQALFVRIPAEHARRLDRAAFELRRPKQALVSELVERYIDDVAEGGRRRVTVETLEPDTLVVGHHSFRPREPAPGGASAPEVLRAEQAAEFLQVSREVVERLAREGELPGRMIAGEWRFSRAALLDWLARAPEQRAGGVADGGR
jgi:excisionase family DNA binding protein